MWCCCCHVQELPPVQELPAQVEAVACLVHGRVAEVQPGRSFLQTLSGQLGSLWRSWRQPQHWRLQDQYQKRAGCSHVAGCWQVLVLVLQGVLVLQLVLVLVMLTAYARPVADHAGKSLLVPGALLQHLPWHIHLRPALLHLILSADADPLAAVSIVAVG
jgi:hypothetical protein